MLLITFITYTMNRYWDQITKFCQALRSGTLPLPALSKLTISNSTPWGFLNFSTDTAFSEPNSDV